MNELSFDEANRAQRRDVVDRGASGFTLTEVLLTLAILTIVMIPMLMWTGLVIESGRDTSGSDNTNVMTEISGFLARDVSGVGSGSVDTPGDAQDGASQANFSECGMPIGANSVLELGRGDSWIVYYTTKNPKGVITLTRLRCTSLEEPVLEPDEEFKEWSFSSVIAENLESEPAASYNSTEIHMTVDPPNMAPLSVRVERNVTTDPIAEPESELIPVIDCAPSCSVSRKGSLTAGSADPSAL